MFVWLGSPLESLGYCYVVLHVLNLTDLPSVIITRQSNKLHQS